MKPYLEVTELGEFLVAAVKFAHERFSLCVCLEMCPDVAPLRKSFSALRALEGLLSRVAALVRLQVAKLREPLSTAWKFARLRGQNRADRKLGSKYLHMVALQCEHDDEYRGGSSGRSSWSILGYHRHNACDFVALRRHLALGNRPGIGPGAAAAAAAAGGAAIGPGDTGD